MTRCDAAIFKYWKHLFFRFQKTMLRVDFYLARIVATEYTFFWSSCKRFFGKWTQRVKPAAFFGFLPIRTISPHFNLTWFISLWVNLIFGNLSSKSDFLHLDSRRLIFFFLTSLTILETFYFWVNSSGYGNGKSFIKICWMLHDIPK